MPLQFPSIHYELGASLVLGYTDTTTESLAMPEDSRLAGMKGEAPLSDSEDNSKSLDCG